MDVLKRITNLRKERNWTEYQMAERAGLTQSTVSSWYRKNMVPSIPSLEKICKAFDMTLSQFFADDKDLIMELKPEQIRLLKYASKLKPKQTEALIKFINTL